MMASPHLKRMLKQYQNTALNSLHGPGPDTGFLSQDTAVAAKLAQVDVVDTPLSLPLKQLPYKEYNYKKLLIYEDSISKNHDQQEYVKPEFGQVVSAAAATAVGVDCERDPEVGEGRGLGPAAAEDKDNLHLRQQEEVKQHKCGGEGEGDSRNGSSGGCEGGGLDGGGGGCKDETLPPTAAKAAAAEAECPQELPGYPEVKSGVVSAKEEPGEGGQAAKRACTPPPPSPPSSSSVAAPSSLSSTSSNSSSSSTCSGAPATSTTGAASLTAGIVEPNSFLAPPPFPPQPSPILAAADPGSPGSEHGRGETVLDGEVIACFMVGGEPRLCLPQILNSVLRDFTLAQINAVCEERQLYCSRCTPAQLDVLRNTGVLPSCAKSCGLITKTDAQRLTHELLHSHPSKAPPPPVCGTAAAPGSPSAPPPPPGATGVRVYHTCFGKCKGVLRPDLYTSALAGAIECCECRGLFAPSWFVRHVHRARENRTCHWGFDAENWRTYLMLAKDQHVPLDKAETTLDEFKAKFELAGAKHKRKQDGLEVKDELNKKVRGDDTPAGTPPTTMACGGVAYGPGGVAYDPALLYMWRQYASLTPPWAATPILTPDGKPLPPPPPSFVRDSVPAPVPPYLSQGPPVLVDPAHVVPISETQKFERHYQPNVALAPPKVREKLARDPTKDLPGATQIHIDMTAEKMTLRKGAGDEGVVYVIKGECPSPCPTSAAAVVHPHQEQHKYSAQVCQSGPPVSVDVALRKARSPDRTPVPYNPEIELSTTDSDTDSVSSVTTKNETVEEAEALLRGWSDRAAASKVAQLVAGLVGQLTAKDRQYAVVSREVTQLHRRLEQQSRDQQAALSSLRGQLCRSSKEDQLREKMVLMEAEIRALREEVHRRPSIPSPAAPCPAAVASNRGSAHPSVIAPTSSVKTEPCERMGGGSTC